MPTSMFLQKAVSLMDKHQALSFDSCWLSGSHAYGTAHAGSDLDIRALHQVDTRLLCDPTLSQNKIKQLHYQEDAEADFSSQSLIRFIELNLMGNANACEALWLPEDAFFLMGEAMEVLRAHRHVFLSKRLFFAHGHYAIQASKALKNKRKKLTAVDPVTQPLGVDYLTLVASEGSGARLEDYASGYQLVELHDGTFGLYAASGRTPWTSAGVLQISDRAPHGVPIAIAKYDAKGYKGAMNAYKGYQSWRDSSTRRTEEEASGYSGKTAMQVVRLLRIAKELGEQGVVNVVRPDATHLLAIRRGEIDYERVMAEIHLLTDEVLAMGKTLDLPQSPDSEAVSELYRRLQR